MIKNLEGCNAAHDNNKTHLSNFKAIAIEITKSFITTGL